MFFFRTVVYIFGDQTYSMTYEEASNQCAVRGGSLALPHDLQLAQQNG